MGTKERSIEELLSTVQSTMELINEFLAEIKDSDHVSEIEAKLQSVVDMHYILNTIKDGNYNTPVITRIAILENNLDHLKEEMEKYIDDSQAILSRMVVLESTKTVDQIKKERNVYLLKLAAASLPGIISLILVMIKLFF